MYRLGGGGCYLEGIGILTFRHNICCKVQNQKLFPYCMYPTPTNLLAEIYADMQYRP